MKLDSPPLDRYTSEPRDKIKIKGPLQVSELNYGIEQKFGFINGVDNVNWPPYRDSKS